MFPYHEHEAPGERLLLVQMEARPNYASDHRHIVAYVIRRACADVPRANNPASVQTYYDGANPAGYRTANWHVGCNKKNAIYVADMTVRGQIDAYMPAASKIADGKPYGGDVRFQPYQVDHMNALAMANTFRRYNKFKDGLYMTGSVPAQDNEFFRACLLVWTFLDLKKFVIRIPNTKSTALSDPAGFVEHGWADGLAYVQATYLDEFAVKPAAPKVSDD
jgi:hypothetical protein